MTFREKAAARTDSGGSLTGSLTGSPRRTPRVSESEGSPNPEALTDDPFSQGDDGPVVVALPNDADAPATEQPVA